MKIILPYIFQMVCDHIKQIILSAYQSINYLSILSTLTTIFGSTMFSVLFSSALSTFFMQISELFAIELPNLNWLFLVLGLFFVITITFLLLFEPIVDTIGELFRENNIYRNIFLSFYFL